MKNFNVNDIVLCVDPKHKLYLEYGKVIKISKKFIRVKFNGILLWLDINIIEKAPEEWINDA